MFEEKALFVRTSRVPGISFFQEHNYFDWSITTQKQGYTSQKEKNLKIVQ